MYHDRPAARWLKVANACCSPTLQPPLRTTRHRRRYDNTRVRIELPRRPRPLPPPMANRRSRSGLREGDDLRVTPNAALGHKKLDVIRGGSATSEERLTRRRPRRSTTHDGAKCAEEGWDWEVIDRMPGEVRGGRCRRTSMSFYDLDEYVRLVAATSSVDCSTRTSMDPGGEAGPSGGRDDRARMARRRSREAADLCQRSLRTAGDDTQWADAGGTSRLTIDSRPRSRPRICGAPT